MSRKIRPIARVLLFASIFALAAQASAQRAGGGHARGGGGGGAHQARGGGAHHAQGGTRAHGQGTHRGGQHGGNHRGNGTHHATGHGNYSGNRNVNRNTNVNVNHNVNVNRNVHWNGHYWGGARIAGPRYYWPHGYGYVRRSVGWIMPAAFLTSAYYYSGWATLGLAAPPPHFQWVRYGPDLLLVNTATGQVTDVRYGVFAG